MHVLRMLTSYAFLFCLFLSCCCLPDPPTGGMLTTLPRSALCYLEVLVPLGPSLFRGRRNKCIERELWNTHLSRKLKCALRDQEVGRYTAKGE